jgi:hypothetical protein
MMYEALEGVKAALKYEFPWRFYTRAQNTNYEQQAVAKLVLGLILEL